MHSPRHLRRSATDESGQSTVEFALVLLPLLIIVVGIVEFAIAFHYWNDETHLASAGARYAAVSHTPDGTSVQSYVRSQMTTDALRNGGTSRTPDPATVCVSFPNGAAVGQPVKVEVKTTYHFASILGLSSPTHDVRGTATMRLERTPDSSIVPEGCS